MTLKEILYRRYDGVKKSDPIKSDFETFYNNESRKLTDIFKLVQLDEWSEKLKSNGEYNFSQKEADFVLCLFDEYSGKDAKLDAIRRMDFRKFDPAFVDYLCQGFLEMFREAGASPEELAHIEVKLQERIFADFYQARAQYNATRKRLDQFFKTCAINNLSDYREFLSYFAGEFEKLSAPFIESMQDLAEAMDAIRLEECVDDDRLKNEVEKISLEEMIWNELEFVYIDKISDAIANDEELKGLKQKYESLINPSAKKLINPGAKKPPFVNKIEKTAQKLGARISAREKEIEKYIIEEEHTKALQRDGKLHENERFTLPNIENPYMPSAENILSSHDVLVRALERLKEDDENLESDKDSLE
ncbi:MAG: hypothetical protein K2J81_07070 [Treponemataceae bacterium]|nr:hypothetical protein [Treponemataceae bacterium]